MPSILLLMNEILYGRMYQNIMSLCLFTLLLKWIIEVQAQIPVQIRKFSLDSTHQSTIRTFPCSSHKLIPFINTNTATICFVIHRHCLHFFYFPYFETLASLGMYGFMCLWLKFGEIIKTRNRVGLSIKRKCWSIAKRYLVYNHTFNFAL